MKILSRVKNLVGKKKPHVIGLCVIKPEDCIATPEIKPSRVAKATARRNYLRRIIVDPENYEGCPCKECGEIIEVYSRSGYCRECYHWRQLMSRPTAAGRKCWNCSNQAMKIYKTNKGKCFLKCANCGATDNLVKVKSLL